MDTGFGWIEIRGKRYEKDLVIHVDGSIGKRRKRLSKPLREEYGHTPLSEMELVPLLDEQPDKVLVGTGQYGDLPLTPQARRMLDDQGAIVRSTPDILPLLDGYLSKGKRVVAILHLTC